MRHYRDRPSLCLTALTGDFWWNPSHSWPLLSDIEMYSMQPSHEMTGNEGREGHCSQSGRHTAGKVQRQRVLNDALP